MTIPIVAENFINLYGQSSAKPGLKERVNKLRKLEAAYQKRDTESIIAEHLGDAYYVYELKDKRIKLYVFRGYLFAINFILIDPWNS